MKRLNIKRVLAKAAFVIFLVAGLVLGYLWWLGSHLPAGADDLPPMAEPTADVLQHGQYLVQIGGCMGCHTAPGGEALAGGGVVRTGFGVFYGSNLTPDEKTGLGMWSREDFTNAMRYGIGKEGRLLYPAFPYEQYTALQQSDIDAMYLYLRSVPAVARERQLHQLEPGFGSQWALALWRGMYFRSDSQPSHIPPDDTVEYGGYLVKAVAHCAACHSPRNGLGALSKGQAMQGSGLAVEGWIAPSLLNSNEAGVQQWSLNKTAQFLRSGRAEDGVVASGPMADAVFWSTQFLSERDAMAVAKYLKQLPDASRNTVATSVIMGSDKQRQGMGRSIYKAHCAACHGEDGVGKKGQFPPLRHNRAVLANDPGNMLRSILFGGYAPSVAGMAPASGMPPFLQDFSDEEVAAVATYIRQSWGHQASAVATMDVFQARQAR